MESPLPESRLAEIKDCCYRAVARGESPPCIDPDELMQIIQELDEYRLIFQPIRQLIGEQDASVTLVGVAPPKRKDGSRQPLGAHGKVSVTVVNNRTDWLEVPFLGETYGDALSRAADQFRLYEEPTRAWP